MPLQATSGAASYDAFGGGVPVVPNYIEEVFSTTLYTGNGSTQTITNGIDLSANGGLVWGKSRSAVNDHFLINTVRGAANSLSSNLTDGNSYDPDRLTAFTTSGFSVGTSGSLNTNGTTYASWTFRKQPKFFDVVTWTGNGVNGRQIPHNLGSVPGCIIVKATSLASDWRVYHRSLGASEAVTLNSTAASSNQDFWNYTSPTSTVFSVSNYVDLNGNGHTYVAYLFAHDAGGFGLTGTDNVISCGSYVGTGAVGNAVALGYEPQWLMVKNVTSAFDWIMYDNMRGMPASATNTGETKFLRPNTSGAEAGGGTIIPTATGFQANTSYQGANFSGETYIYIAIRRGPMKVPTSGTSVFSPQIATSSGSASNTVTTNFPVDLAITQVRNGYFAELLDRLRGDSQSTYVRLRSASTAAEATGAFGLGFDNNTGYVDNYNWQNFGGGPFVYWNFKRAPSFFDEVCYLGTGSATTFTHNLGVVPELMIVKSRSTTGSFWTYSVSIGNTKYLRVNDTGGSGTNANIWDSTTPTSSVFTIGSYAGVNTSGTTYVAYLFATCAGVSKVGSYTGNGSTQTINCGFTGGARFVMVKATSTTGDWMVADSARGIVSGSDPYLELNNTNAEVTGEDWLDTDSTGFVVNEVSGSNANTNGVTYIYLAIA